MALQIIIEITSFLCSLPFAPLWGAFIKPLLPGFNYMIFFFICVITAILKPIINDKKVSWGKAFLYAFGAYYCFQFLWNLIFFSAVCAVMSYTGLS
jgi:hypothetical protein